MPTPTLTPTSTPAPGAGAGAAPAPLSAINDFAAIDWRQPWLDPWRVQGEATARLAQARGTLAALRQLPGLPVHFVPQSSLPAGRAYESHIFETGQCPVREDLHDFFNGLCWLHFPRSKRQLNQLQAHAIQEQSGAPGVGRRGALRDAITVFDENGAILAGPPEALDPLWAALRAHDWRHALVTLRPLWRQVRCVLFGHALLEKLAHPRKAITAHVLALPLDEAGRAAAASLQAFDSLQVLDSRLAQRLQADTLCAKPFTPLPVLGVPGWCADNGDFSFYDDASVFRPARPQNLVGG